MIPILLYHSVPRTAQTSERFSVAFSTFIAHIDAIVESERTPITVGQLASGLRNECALPDRAMAITFDDFYDDTPSAVEALCARGLCASVFVTTGKIETEPVLWHDGLLQLAALPRLVEIGGAQRHASSLRRAERHRNPDRGARQQAPARTPGSEARRYFRLSVRSV